MNQCQCACQPGLTTIPLAIVCHMTFGYINTAERKEKGMNV